jgi:hypothetical protein
MVPFNLESGGRVELARRQDGHFDSNPQRKSHIEQSNLPFFSVSSRQDSPLCLPSIEPCLHIKTSRAKWKGWRQDLADRPAADPDVYRKWRICWCRFRRVGSLRCSNMQRMTLALLLFSSDICVSSNCLFGLSICYLTDVRSSLMRRDYVDHFLTGPRRRGDTSSRLIGFGNVQVDHSLSN